MSRRRRAHVIARLSSGAPAVWIEGSAPLRAAAARPVLRWVRRGRGDLPPGATSSVRIPGRGLVRTATGKAAVIPAGVEDGSAGKVGCVFKIASIQEPFRRRSRPLPVRHSESPRRRRAFEARSRSGSELLASNVRSPERSAKSATAEMLRGFDPAASIFDRCFVGTASTGMVVRTSRDGSCRPSRGRAAGDGQGRSRESELPQALPSADVSGIAALRRHVRAAPAALQRFERSPRLRTARAQRRATVVCVSRRPRYRRRASSGHARIAARARLISALAHRRTGCAIVQPNAGSTCAILGRFNGCEFGTLASWPATRLTTAGLRR